MVWKLRTKPQRILHENHDKAFRDPQIPSKNRLLINRRRIFRLPFPREHPPPPFRKTNLHSKNPLKPLIFPNSKARKHPRIPLNIFPTIRLITLHFRKNRPKPPNLYNKQQNRPSKANKNPPFFLEFPHTQAKIFSFRQPRRRRGPIILNNSNIVLRKLRKNHKRNPKSAFKNTTFKTPFHSLPFKKLPKSNRLTSSILFNRFSNRIPAKKRILSPKKQKIPPTLASSGPIIPRKTLKTRRKAANTDNFYIKYRKMHRIFRKKTNNTGLAILSKQHSFTRQTNPPSIRAFNWYFVSSILAFFLNYWIHSVFRINSKRNHSKQKIRISP